jgi:hypothetical protein
MGVLHAEFRITVGMDVGTTAVVQDPTAGERVCSRIGPFWYRYPTAGAWVPKRLAALAQTPGI